MKFNADPAFRKRREEAYREKKNDPNAGSNAGRDYIFSEPVTYYKVKDGDNRIRLLPNQDPEALFPWMEIFIHYGIGANNNQYLCLARMKNMACPICEEHKAAKDNNRPEKEISALRPNQRALVYLIDRTEPDPTKALQVWPMPFKKVSQQILSISFKKSNGELLYFDDPENGYDVFFEKRGKELSTEYNGIVKDDEPSPLHADSGIANKWLEHIAAHPLHKMLNFKSYDYLKAILNGEDPNIAPIAQEAPPITAKPSVRKLPVSPGPTSPVSDELNMAKLVAMTQEQLIDIINENPSLDLDPEGWETEELAQAIGLQLGLSS